MQACHSDSDHFRLKNTDASGEDCLLLARNHSHVVFGLKVEPEAWLHPEIDAETQGGVSGDWTLTVHYVADAAWRHVNIRA